VDGARSALVGLVGAVVSLAFFALVEVGGITYRKDCPTARGTVSHDWTVKWYLPLPFVFRPSEIGCEVHTGARVFLSSLGIDPIPQKSAADLANQNGARGDTDHVYLNGLYVIFADLRQASTTPGYSDAFVQRTDGRVHALVPPAYVRSRHATFVKDWDRAVEARRAGLAASRRTDRSGIQRAGRAARTATDSFVATGQVLYARVQAHIAKVGK
jgi:hypothetical protein